MTERGVLFGVVKHAWEINCKISSITLARCLTLQKTGDVETAARAARAFGIKMNATRMYSRLWNSEIRPGEKFMYEA